MEYSVWIAVVIGLAEIGLMSWQVRIMSANAPTIQSTTPTSRFSYWPVVAMGILAVVSWIPYALNLGQPDRVNAISAWGNSATGCYSVIDSGNSANTAASILLAWHVELQVQPQTC